MKTSKVRALLACSTAVLALAASASPAVARVKVGGKLPQAFVGQFYPADVTASGGEAPYEFNLASGALPEGLGLGGGSAVESEIEGLPEKAETASFTISATDASASRQTGSKAFTIVVNPQTFASGGFLLEETNESGEVVGRESGELLATKESAGKISGTDRFEFPGTFKFTKKSNKISFTIEEFEGSPFEYSGTCDPVAGSCSGTREGREHFTLVREVG